jgi:hypothetical protein
VDDPKGFLRDSAVGCQIVGRVEIDRVDLALVDKPLDRQRVARLDLDLIQIGRLDRSTGPSSGSWGTIRMRLCVCLCSRWKLTRLLLLVALYNRTGQETRESLR